MFSWQNVANTQTTCIHIKGEELVKVKQLILTIQMSKRKKTPAKPPNRSMEAQLPLLGK